MITQKNGENSKNSKTLNTEYVIYRQKKIQQLGENGNMKANRKFRDGEEAVSAVIGVILMVAITVAIAATVYVYVSGMIGTSPQSTPNLQFVKDNINNKLTVASADPGDLKWEDMQVTYNNVTTTYITLNYGVLTYDIWDGTTAQELVDIGSTVEVTAGDYFNLTGTGTIRLRHIPTNTLIGTWEFN